MPHTDRTTVVALYIKSLINTNKVTLGIDNVLYGEHYNIPSGITAIINSGTKTRRLERVTAPAGGTRNDMIVIVTIINNRIGSEEEQRLAVDQISEEVEKLLHLNTTMGGNIIHGFVHSWDPSVRIVEGSMYRATQMIFVGQTKTNLTPLP